MRMPCSTSLQKRSLLSVSAARALRQFISTFESEKLIGTMMHKMAIANTALHPNILKRK